MVSLLAPALQTASRYVCRQESRQESTPIIDHSAMSLAVATTDQTDLDAQRVGKQMGTYQRRSCCGGPLLWSTCQQYSSTCSHPELQGRHLCEGPPVHRSHILVNASNLLGKASLYNLHAHLEETQCHFAQIACCQQVEMPVSAVTKGNLLQETCYAPLLLLRSAKQLI